MVKNKSIKIKHVVFDWSGTLYDDHRVSFLATQKIICQLAGHKLTYAEYKNEFTLPVLPFYRRYGVDLSIERINKIYFDIFADHYDQGELFAGVRETLKYLYQHGITVSVFSTLRQEYIEDLCSKLKIEKYFQFLHGSVCDKRLEMKSHLRKIKAKKENIIFIGDMDHDVEAGNLHGLLSGCVINGYHNVEKLLQARPRLVWRHQSDWLPFFKSVQQTFPEKKSREYPVATVGALIFNRNGEVLLILTHKWGFTYGIPGGKVEKGETLKLALVREISEETGLKITVGEMLMVQDCVNSSEFYVPKSHFLLFNYLAKAQNAVVKLNDEAESYLWIKPKDALNLNLNQPTRLLIENFLQV